MRSIWRRGFSLVELIVVVGVTALLAGVLVSYNSQGRSQVALSVERAKIAQVIGRARSLAISTYLQNPTDCGFGVQFNIGPARNYSLVQFNNATCSDLSGGTVTVRETFRLDPALDFGSGASQIGLLVFVPPDPTLLMEDASGSPIAGIGKIYLAERGGGNPIALDVGFAGQVSF
jgi:prepilin-type N-terminal cleavage/methylation domain-containing protein